jgi:RES domain-containing protein
MLAHIEPAHFARNFVLIAADLPGDLSTDVVDPDDLPDDWRTRYEDEALQQIGADWLDRVESVALIAPSAVVPTERNIILNPDHPDFGAIEIHDPEPYRFDPRLMR